MKILKYIGALAVIAFCAYSLHAYSAKQVQDLLKEARNPNTSATRVQQILGALKQQRQGQAQYTELQNIIATRAGGAAAPEAPGTRARPTPPPTAPEGTGAVLTDEEYMADPTIPDNYRTFLRELINHGAPQSEKDAFKGMDDTAKNDFIIRKQEEWATGGGPKGPGAVLSDDEYIADATIPAKYKAFLQELINHGVDQASRDAFKTMTDAAKDAYMATKQAEWGPKPGPTAKTPAEIEARRQIIAPRLTLLEGTELVGKRKTLRTAVAAGQKPTQYIALMTPIAEDVEAQRAIFMNTSTPDPLANAALIKESEDAYTLFHMADLALREIEAGKEADKKPAIMTLLVTTFPEFKGLETELDPATGGTKVKATYPLTPASTAAEMPHMKNAVNLYK